MQLFLAPGARLLTNGCVVNGCVVLALTAALGASAAVAKDARRAQRQTIIEDIAPPTRESFDEIVVQLPPLVPVQRKAQAPAPAAPATPSTARSSPAAPTAQAEPQAPDSALENLDVGTQAVAQEPPTTHDVAAKSQPAPPPQVGQAAPEAEAPKEPVAEQRPVEHDEPSHAQAEASPADVAAPLDLRGGDQPAESPPVAAAPEAASQPPPVVDNAQPEAAPAVEAAEPAPARDSVASEGEGDGSIFETWQLLVAGLALSGLLVIRMRADKKTAAKEAVAPSAKVEKLAAFAKAAQSKIAPVVTAKLELLRSWRVGLTASLRKGSAAAVRKTPGADGTPAAAASAKAERPSIANWSEIAATLRAKVAPPKAASTAALRRAGAVDGAAAARVEAVTESESVAERGRWEQSDRDGPELLEPGASSTQAIIMNARKKFRTAQG